MEAAKLDRPHPQEILTNYAMLRTTLKRDYVGMKINGFVVPPTVFNWPSKA